MKDPKTIQKVSQINSKADELLFRGKKMVKVEVAFIQVDMTTGTPILFLREKEGNPRYMVPIWIAQPEAIAIQYKLKGETPPRPLTHDLMKNIIESFGATASAAYVHDLKDSTYFGQIDLKVSGKTLEIDSRASDAVAVALRFNAPIYVAEHIIQESGFPETALSEAEAQQARNTLENLDDETLGRYTV